eukprot:6490598-Amphidinium_carterae.1
MTPSIASPQHWVRLMLGEVGALLLTLWTETRKKAGWAYHVYHSVYATLVSTTKVTGHAGHSILSSRVARQSTCAGPCAQQHRSAIIQGKHT